MIKVYKIYFKTDLLVLKHKYYIEHVCVMKAIQLIRINMSIESTEGQKLRYYEL